ncbi:hypothetical protein [Johnsonella ignava]|uniref:hypothetical protein n=1 Tax=Johnsonella ignava TaxID=43995 RepID=UPI0023F362F6|nr:hypothetical protein [Johnsonella ignava]
MPQPISDYKLFFADARRAVEELNVLTSEEKRLVKEEAGLSADIKHEQKVCSDTIASNIKEGRNDICKKYDEIIKKHRVDLKRVKAAREKAKNQGIKERINEETIDLRTENRNLKIMIRDMFASNKVPAFCNTDLYYTMYFPNKPADYLSILTAAIICLVAIPAFIYYMLEDKKIENLIIIILADIIIFGGSYLIIANMTMIKNLSILKDGEILRKSIDDNIKKIRVISKSIVNDKDEKNYDLASFDDEIAHLEQAIEESENVRQEALNAFDTVRQDIITDEINAQFQPEIDRLGKLFKATSDELRHVRTRLDEKNAYVEDNFGIYLGEEFLDVEKIDILSDIMDRAIVTNLDEAIEEYRNQMDE